MSKKQLHGHYFIALNQEANTRKIYFKILIFCTDYENKPCHANNMAFSETQLTALESAIAQGALTVSYRGAGGEQRTITYHSMTEMLRLRDMLRSELGVAAPSISRGRIINLATGRGL
jgi:hypothetical protein